MSVCEDQPGREKLCHNDPNEGAIAAIANEEEHADGERGDPANVAGIGGDHLRPCFKNACGKYFASADNYC